jgi:7-carboxy-7-deazaguanine synthase
MSQTRKRDTLVVKEIYKSIQGESTWAGLPCVFVRLTGCDLRCVWCDAAHAFTGGDRLTVPEVIARVEALACPLVEITGGEPLLQPAVHPLMSALLDRGHRVLIETGGHLDISGVDPRAVRIIDVKCPASGESDKVRWENLGLLRPGDQVKFVLSDRADYDWARDVVLRHGLLARTEVLFSVAHPLLPPARLAAWLLEDRLPVRLQLQIHKYIWSPDTPRI